jgi:LPXTG-motif cell wall-anchored protein
VGGKFIDYWNTHGGLAQQGYPISNEFQEKSDLADGTYAINVHKSATEASVYVSCGNIEALQVIGMPQTGSSTSFLPTLGLVALALGLLGTGWKVSRRRA